ncbi:exonuclease domain-containing protein [Nesterenkonia alba]|uniref:exonuclease domain-containing protein n=1 Tax=Nesterenkonia alba TaxID=515814 RepID=UPI00040D60B6|nr:exonuclease domain-containing protein [Nesterenkonia alba]
MIPDHLRPQPSGASRAGTRPTGPRATEPRSAGAGAARVQEPTSLADLRPPRIKGLNFTAVDFETANGYRGSPCAIGLVRIRDGNVDELYFKRMRPPEGYDRFDPRNVAIHGITPERVARQPRFAELFGEIRDFIGEDVLIAHNAAFDIEVFEAALEVSGLDSPGLQALCSVQLARAVYQLDSHALPQAAAEAGFNLKHHHHALWDARAAAAIVVDIAERTQPHTVDSVHQVFAAHDLEAEVLPAWQAPRKRLSRATRQVEPFAHLFDARVEGVDPAKLPDLMRWQDEGRNPIPSPQADPDHPLAGEQVVFTGTLSVPRPDAKKLAADLGAQTASRVTGSTTLLVIGDGFSTEDEHDAAAAAEEVSSGPLGSAKAQDALRRRSAGQQIRFIGEAEFRQMVGPLWPEHLTPLPTAE